MFESGTGGEAPMRRPGRRSRNAAALVPGALAAAAVVLSCGIFDTRESPPPSEGGETPRQTPVNVDAVLYNYRNALEYRDQGNYEEALSEDFVFLPDSEDRAFFVNTRGSDVFEHWGRDKEMQAVRLIFSDSESLSVVKFKEVDRNELPDTAFVRIDYTFRQRRAGADTAAMFAGRAEIHLKANQSGMWSIDRWKDISLSQRQTWGRLKGNAVGG